MGFTGSEKCQTCLSGGTAAAAWCDHSSGQLSGTQGKICGEELGGKDLSHEI